MKTKSRTGGEAAVESTPNTWHRVLLLLYAPERLFASLRTNWSWAGVYMLSAIALLASSALAMPITRTILERDLSQNGFTDDMIQVALTGQTIGILLAPLVQPLFKAFLYAFMGMLVSGLLNIKVRFSKLFSIVMWSSVPAFVLGSLFNSSLIRFLGESAITKASFSPAIFMPDTMVGSSLHSLLLSLDIFAVWTLLLIGYGYKTVHKTSTFHASVVVMLLFGVSVVATMSLTNVTAGV